MYATFGSDVRELHSTRVDKLECEIDVLGLLYAHSWVLIVPTQRYITYYSNEIARVYLLSSVHTHDFLNMKGADVSNSGE